MLELMDEYLSSNYIAPGREAGAFELLFISNKICSVAGRGIVLGMTAEHASPKKKTEERMFVLFLEVEY